MGLVVALRMFEIQRSVFVIVLMALRQVEHDASDHRHCARKHPDTAASFTERECHQGAHEGRERSKGALPACDSVHFDRVIDSLRT